MKPIIQNRIDSIKKPVSKVLIIQTAFLGDVILATPLLRVARNLFPQAQIHFLTIPECSIVGVGFVDKVIQFDKRRRIGRRRRWRNLVRELRKEKYDLALIPHRSLRSALTATLARIPVRIGFDKGIGSLLLTHRAHYKRDMYEGLRNLELLKPLGNITDNGIPELQPSEDDRKIVDELLEHIGVTKGEYVTFAPGSVWKTKRWKRDYYRQLAEKINKKYGYPALLIGGKDDAKDCEYVAECVGFCFAGKLTVLQSAVLLQGSRMMVSGDTAPAHIATAMGVRQVVIYGSTTPQFGFFPPVETAKPFGIKLVCRPCSNHGRNFCPRLSSFKCLNDITPDMVLEILKEWL